MVDEREQQILHSWDSNAAAWTESIRTQQIESRKVATNKAIIDAISKYKPANALDVGCGEGWLVRELSNHGIEATGTDGASFLIDEAKKLGAGAFYVLTYDELARPSIVADTEYDAIVCNFALIGESIHELLVALAKMLSAKGKLFIQTLHPFSACGDGLYQDGWRTETFASFGPAYREAMPWYFRTISSWLSEITAAGLNISECSEPCHPSTYKPLSLLLTCELKTQSLGASETSFLSPTETQLKK